MTQRYVNADGYVFTGQDMQSGNMFAYCGNNPVNRSDPFGGMYVDNSCGQRLSPEEAKENIEQWKAYYRGEPKAKKPLPQIFGAAYSVETQYRTPKTTIFLPGASYSSGSGETTVYKKTGDSTRAISVYAVSRADNLFLSAAGLKLNVGRGSFALNLGLDDISIASAITNGNCNSSCSVKIDLYNYKIGLEAKETITNNQISTYTYSNMSIDIFSIFLAAVYIGTNGAVPCSPELAPVY